MATVALDFDGVLHLYTSGWTGVVPTDPPVPGAVAFVQSLLDSGYEVVVMTTRAQTPEGYDATRQWLLDNDFPFVKITDKKIPAVAYVDDRAVHFDTTAANFEATRVAVDFLANRSHGAKK